MKRHPVGEQFEPSNRFGGVKDDLFARRQQIDHGDVRTVRHPSNDSSAGVVGKSNPRMGWAGARIRTRARAVLGEIEAPPCLGVDYDETPCGQDGNESPVGTRGNILIDELGQASIQKEIGFEFIAPILAVSAMDDLEHTIFVRIPARKASGNPPPPETRIPNDHRREKPQRRGVGGRARAEDGRG